MTNIHLQSILRLQTWLSPVFPVGGFAYSHGLERAVHDGIVQDEETLALWLISLLSHGSPWNDAVLLAAGFARARDAKKLEEVIELGQAMAISNERQLETMAQGQAFLEAVGHWPLPDGFDKPIEAPLPVAVGVICGVLDVPLDAGVSAYLQAFTNNQLQAAIRLSVLGQKGAARLMARLEPVVIGLGEKAAKSTLDDLASASIQADIMAMNHEHQTTRLFRS
ncbi:MAG: urease accessory protein UreF [Hyphomicrobiales bacterium]